VTLFRTVATLFQHCNIVLCKKLLLQIFLCNITFDEDRLLRGGNLKASLTSYDLLQHSVLDAWRCTLNFCPGWSLVMTDYVHCCSNFYNVLFRAGIASFFSNLRKQLTFCIMLPLVSPQNNICEMNTKIQYCWCATTQLLVVLFIGWKWSFCAHSSVVISLENQWWHHKMLAVFSGYSGTSIYKPLCNEVLSIMNDIPCQTNSRICGKEPWYNETSL